MAEYIDHLAFLLEPHLNLLPSKVTAKIWARPEDIGVIVMATDRHVPKLTPKVKMSLVGDIANDESEIVKAAWVWMACVPYFIQILNSFLLTDLEWLSRYFSITINNICAWKVIDFCCCGIPACLYILVWLFYFLLSLNVYYAFTLSSLTDIRCARITSHVHEHGQFLELRCKCPNLNA